MFLFYCVGDTCIYIYICKHIYAATLKRKEWLGNWLLFSIGGDRITASAPIIASKGVIDSVRKYGGPRSIMSLK